VCSPPVRTGRAHHQADLWKGLRTNELSVVSTDHCPFCFKEQKELGIGDFSKIPNGMGTVEHRMDLIYQGVVAGEISLTRWVETCSVTPARMFGLYPRKGAILPGSDADVVIYDPAAQHTISVENHHMAVDYSAWEGTRIDGKVDTVISRGSVIIEGDRYTGRKGHGQFLKRGLSQYLN
jgi:dihydropyrimidinase